MSSARPRAVELLVALAWGARPAGGGRKPIIIDQVTSPREVTPPMSDVSPLSDPEVPAGSSRASLAIEIRVPPSTRAAVAIRAGAPLGLETSRA